MLNSTLLGLVLISTYIHVLLHQHLHSIMQYFININIQIILSRKRSYLICSFVEILYKLGMLLGWNCSVNIFQCIVLLIANICTFNPAHVYTVSVHPLQVDEVAEGRYWVQSGEQVLRT